MDIQAITESLRAKTGEDSGLNAVLKFDLGTDGVVVIDGKSEPNTVDNNDREADCTITVARENLVALMSGELNAMNAFMTGKIKVAGDMGVAMKLQKVM